MIFYVLTRQTVTPITGNFPRDQCILERLHFIDKTGEFLYLVNGRLQAGEIDRDDRPVR